MASTPAAACPPTTPASLAEPSNDCTPRLGDAFGDMIRQAYSAEAKRGRVFEVVERDDGMIEVGDASRYFDPIDLWTPNEAIAINWVHGAVLDVGVGAGRHALELIRRGQPAVGIDSSAGAVETATIRGVPSHLAEVGQRSGPLPLTTASFDTALLLGNNLGLLSNLSTAGLVLRQLGDLLADDGCIVGSSMDPHLRPAPHDTEYMARNQSAGRMAGQYRLRLRYAQVASDWFDYLFLSPDELEVLLQDVGGWVISKVEVQGPWYSVQLVRT